MKLLVNYRSKISVIASFFLLVKGIKRSGLNNFLPSPSLRLFLCADSGMKWEMVITDQIPVYGWSESKVFLKGTFNWKTFLQIIFCFHSKLLLTLFVPSRDFHIVNDKLHDQEKSFDNFLWELCPGKTMNNFPEKKKTIKMLQILRVVFNEFR